MPTKAIPTIVGAGVTLAVTDAALGRRAVKSPKRAGTVKKSSVRKAVKKAPPKRKAKKKKGKKC